MVAFQPWRIQNDPSHGLAPLLRQLHLLVSLVRIGTNHGCLSAIIDPCVHEAQQFALINKWLGQDCQMGPFSPDLLLPTPQIGSVFPPLFDTEWFGQHWLIGPSAFLATLRGLMRAPRDVLKMVVAYLVPPCGQCHNIMTFSEHRDSSGTGVCLPTIFAEILRRH